MSSLEIIRKHIRELGICRGTSLFVHISLKAIGLPVGPGDVITCIAEVLGPDGTLILPTFTARTEDYFDPVSTPTTMGVTPEYFRKMPGVLRSRHPRHPVAASGPSAAFLIEGHEKAYGPCGKDTPFYRHAEMGGQVLLIGVDLDTLTLLHTAEALLDLPYLRILKGRFLDAGGAVQEITMHQAPGGHRGGVRSFEGEFRRQGILSYGKIGSARTMLFSARKILDAMVEILREHPMAALCRSDACPDCTHFKAKIRARDLDTLGAHIAVVLPREPEDGNAFREMMEKFGMAPSYQLLGDLKTVRSDSAEKIPPPPGGETDWILELPPRILMELRQPPEGYTRLAYRPIEAARDGIQPFYGVLYKNRCRDIISDIFVEDGVAGLSGTMTPPLGYLERLYSGRSVPFGEGHAQLREIVSALRMRGFSGTYHILVPDEENLYQAAMRKLREFWNLLP